MTGLRGSESATTWKGSLVSVARAFSFPIPEVRQEELYGFEAFLSS